MDYEYAAEIHDVHDGDTIRVNIDLGFGVTLEERPIRLLGLNAPEVNTESGKVARDFLRSLLPVGAPVVIQTVKDKTEKYGRYLAVVLHDGQNVNELLVSTGHAVYWDGKGLRP